MVMLDAYKDLYRLMQDREFPHLRDHERDSELNGIRAKHNLSSDEFRQAQSDVHMYLLGEEPRARDANYVLYYETLTPGRVGYQCNRLSLAPHQHVIGLTNDEFFILSVYFYKIREDSQFRKTIIELLLKIGELEARAKVDEVILNGTYKRVKRESRF